MEQVGMGTGPIPTSGGGPSKPAVAVLHGVVPLDVATTLIMIRVPGKSLGENPEKVWADSTGRKIADQKAVDQKPG
jgi:hypothetical protein